MTKLSPLALMLQIKKEKQEEEKARQKQVAEAQNRVNNLKQLNEQRFANMLGTPQANFANSVAEGLRSGISEAQAQRQADVARIKAVIERVTQLKNAINEQMIQSETEKKWINQNLNELRQIVSHFPQMNPEQAKTALEPLIEDLSNTMQEKIKVTDVNTMNGTLSIQTSDGSIMQQSLYDLFPALRSRYLLQKGMNNAGFYTDEQLMRQAQREYDDEQAVINREQQRLDRRENREDERWAYQKSAMDNQNLLQRLQQERQHQLESTTQNVVTDDNGNPIISTENEMKQYDTFITKTANKRLPEIKSEEITLEKDKESLSSILENLSELKALRAEADNDPDLKDTMLLIGRGKYSNKLRELISDLPTVASTLGLNPMMIDFIQRVDKASKKYTINLQSQIARKAMGGASIRSNFEFTQVQEMLPSLFGSKKGFDQHLRAAKSFLDSGYSAIKTQEQALEQEYNDYYISPEEFAKQLRQRRR